MMKLDKPAGTVRESEYARVFDESNPNWCNAAEWNLLFLKTQMDYLNNLLRSRGHVFLNEVYDCLGFKRTSAGAVVGWISNGAGDNYVDFQIHGLQKDANPSIQLNFNVDGIMYDKIESD